MNRKQRDKRLARLNAEKKKNHEKNRSGEMAADEMPAQHVERVSEANDSRHEERGFASLGTASIIGVAMVFIVLIIYYIKIR